MRDMRPKCPECGGKLSHKLDCSRRDWRPDRYSADQMGEVIR